MNRTQFIALAGGSIMLSGLSIQGTSDKNTNMKGVNSKQKGYTEIPLTKDERRILFLASLAPSGHNAQPWSIAHIEPYHWIICNEKSSWLPGVDPSQRETILSIGAFIQNLEYAANNLGYSVEFTKTALTNQDKNIVIVKLVKTREAPIYNIKRIEERRTLRANYRSTSLKKNDQTYLVEGNEDFIHFIPNASDKYTYLNDQTINANTLQSYRDEAQQELANWIRFNKEEEEKYRSGLTLPSMEIGGITAWYLKHFYGKEDVMKKSFREKNIKNVKKQVTASAGWLLITSKGNSVTELIEAGKRMERVFLKVRERGIALHPMTQVLEEESIKKSLAADLQIKEPIQFVIRLGYVNYYPEPVSLRRPIDWFVSAAK